MFYNGVWGTVCDDHFDRKAAAVACHMLGFTGLVKCGCDTKIQKQQTYNHLVQFDWPKAV